MSIFKEKGSVVGRQVRRRQNREEQTREEPVTYILEKKPKRNKGVKYHPISSK